MDWFSWHLRWSHTWTSPTPIHLTEILWQISKPFFSKCTYPCYLPSSLIINGNNELSAALKRCPASVWSGKFKGSTLSNDSSEWNRPLSIGMCLGYQVKSTFPGTTQSRVVLSSLQDAFILNDLVWVIKMKTNITFSCDLNLKSQRRKE